MTSSRKDVNVFLSCLKQFISGPEFNRNENFFFIAKKENKDTLLELNYDIDDIIAELLSLDIKNYSETLIDDRDTNPPLLFVFGKTISNKEIYIKIKLRENATPKIIVCVSFHKSLHTMSYPYR